MAKKTIVTTGKGKLALLFLIIAIVGVIFQFIYLYLPLIGLGGGDAAITIIFISSILALAVGILAFILSIFVVPRNIWIILAACVLVFTIIPPIVYVAANGIFPYFVKSYEFPMFFVVPTSLTGALLDFIGFWMAVGGSLIAAVIGFTLPKK